MWPSGELNEQIQLPSITNSISASPFSAALQGFSNSRGIRLILITGDPFLYSGVQQHFINAALQVNLEAWSVQEASAKLAMMIHLAAEPKPDCVLMDWAVISAYPNLVNSARGACGLTVVALRAPPTAMAVMPLDGALEGPTPTIPLNMTALLSLLVTKKRASSLPASPTSHHPSSPAEPSIPKGANGPRSSSLKITLTGGKYTPSSNNSSFTGNHMRSRLAISSSAPLSPGSPSSSIQGNGSPSPASSSLARSTTSEVRGRSELLTDLAAQLEVLKTQLSQRSSVGQYSPRDNSGSSSSAFVASGASNASVRPTDTPSIQLKPSTSTNQPSPTVSQSSSLKQGTEPSEGLLPRSSASSAASSPRRPGSLRRTTDLDTLEEEEATEYLPFVFPTAVPDPPQPSSKVAVERQGEGFSGNEISVSGIVDDGRKIRSQSSLSSVTSQSNPAANRTPNHASLSLQLPPKAPQTTSATEFSAADQATDVETLDIPLISSRQQMRSQPVSSLMAEDRKAPESSTGQLSRTSATEKVPMPAEASGALEASRSQVQRLAASNAAQVQDSVDRSLTASTSQLQRTSATEGLLMRDLLINTAEAESAVSSGERAGTQRRLVDAAVGTDDALLAEHRASTITDNGARGPQAPSISNPKPLSAAMLRSHQMDSAVWSENGSVAWDTGTLDDLLWDAEHLYSSPEVDGMLVDLQGNRITYENVAFGSLTTVPMLEEISHPMPNTQKAESSVPVSAGASNGGVVHSVVQSLHTVQCTGGCPLCCTSHSSRRARNTRAALRTALVSHPVQLESEDYDG